MQFPIVAQDPRFGGGFRSFAIAFWRAAIELGHEPRLVYLSRARGLSPRMGGPRIAIREEKLYPFHGSAVPSVLPEVDAVNQVIGGERIARLVRDAPFAWVVAATAPYGWGALRSGRPYGCWLATDLEDELAARRGRLPLSRRAALVLSEPVLRRLEHRVVRDARVIATISGRSRNGLAGAGGVDRDKVEVWPVPVDIDSFQPLDDAAWEAGLDAPTIVFVGRGRDPRKNLSLLLDAFPAVREQVPGVRLRLVGEPPAGDIGEGVEVAGQVDSVSAAIRHASVLVLPSLQEGFGIAVAEALACGVPVVVTPSGGPEQLVRESAGGLVLEGWDARELADAVTGLLRNRSRLFELRRAGRAYIEREHSYARFVPLVEGALERTASVRPTR
jgi:glycosyltransferase involved in cell wall biosynthesis